jgi:hypothetical protein
MKLDRVRGVIGAGGSQSAHDSAIGRQNQSQGHR